MKKLKTLTAVALILTYVAAPLTLVAADKKEEKAKPYTLEKCIVSDEKLGEMGKPFVFTYEGQEIKLCCKSCQKDFKKEPAKYMKKLKEAEAEKSKAKK
jgi:YHS domain-containing protein